MSDYELNEKDIDGVLRFLKIYDPENATPENAISILEDSESYFDKLAQEKPELLEELKKNLER